MITRTCRACKIEDIVATKDNADGAVFFEEAYYHKNCFIDMCQKKLGNKRCKKEKWQGALDNIAQWQDEARQLMKAAVERDDVYLFLVEHYHISCTNSALFTRLSSIYDGTYYCLAYPISPEELLEEWKFYLPELEAKRKGTNRIGEGAINYDLAVLLTKNAEYRELMKKKKAEDMIRESQRKTEPEVDYNTMALIQQNAQKQRRNNRRYELFKEVMGNGD
jgi:hypothetical protein